MAELFKDAFQSMDFSTEKLGEVLEVAKQSDAKKLNERELRQIEEMLRKLSESFESVSAQEILQTKVARGEFAGQKEKLDELATQYQQMDALIANMTQTLMGLESVRNRFFATSRKLQCIAVFTRKIAKNWRGISPKADPVFNESDKRYGGTGHRFV